LGKLDLDADLAEEVAAATAAPNRGSEALSASGEAVRKRIRETPASERWGEGAGDDGDEPGGGGIEREAREAARDERGAMEPPKGLGMQREDRGGGRGEGDCERTERDPVRA